MAVSAVVGITTAIGTGVAFGFTTGYLIAGFAIGAGFSALTKALMPKIDLGAQMRGTTTTVRDTAGPRKLIYGKARVGGNVVFIHHSGSDNKYLHLVVAFATHEIESYDEIWFNDNLIWTTSGFEDDWGTYVTIDRKFGTADQDASSSLVSSVTAWTNNHKLSGIAYIAFRLEWNQDKFPQGVPNITATIRGRKVYDPRTDTTAYSSNPALCIRDYLIDQKYGLGESAALIDNASLIATANVCDEQVALSDGGTQDRYQCNGVLDTSNQIKSNIENLLSSMGGRISYSNGKYFIQASVYVVPTFSFDESNTISAISTQTKQSRRSLYNGVKGTFISEEKNYKVMDYPAQISSTYELEDGDPIYLDMPLPFVTNNLQAQRIAKVALLKSRQQVVISMTVNLSGLKVKVGDTVNISNERLGYDNKVFEITEYEMVINANGESGVNLTLIETAAAVYDWTTSDEVDFLAGGELDLYDGRTVENVTNLTKTEIGLQGPDGRVLSSVELSWTPPDDAFIEFYKVRYNKTGTTNYFYGETREPRILLSGLDISSNYDFRVQGQNLIGVTSTGASLLDQELNGDQTGPGAPTNTGATGGVDLIAVEWDNPSDIDFKHTEVYVSTGTTIPETPTAKVDGEEYIVSGLEGSETRNFWLKAVDFSGNKSAATAMFSGTSTVAPPAEILEGAITTEKIDDDAVTVQKIAEVLQSTNYNEGTAGWKITKAGNVEFNNGAFRGTVTVGNTDLTEANTINANTTASDVGLGNVPNIDTSAAVALTTIRYGEGLMNIVLYKDQLDGGGANPGEIRLTAGKFVAGSISRTLENDVNTVTPWEGTITPPYAGDHFYVIWGNGAAWASDGSARFTTQDAPTLTCSANSQGIFVAIYDPINDQWKAVNNANATVNFTPLDTDFAIAIGTKKSITGGIDSLVTLVPFVTDPDADQTVATIEAGTTITSGGITLSEGGSIKGGQTAYSTGTGFFLGYESAKYKFSVGSTANYLKWDGSSLSVKGTITVGNTNLTESNTLNANTTASDVGLGSVQNLNAQGQTQSGLISGTTITGGGIVINGGGSIKGGQTDYATGTGFFLGYSSNAYKFSIGSTANYVKWDGTTMSVKGSLVVGNTTLSEANTLNSNQSASDITTGTLDASQVTVTNLSATNITVGTLNANLINVDGTTISVSGTSLAIPTGGVGDSQIADQAIKIGKFAAGITPVRIVSSLPTTNVVEGDTAYLTSDSKLYRYDGSNWIKAVDGADVSSGTLPASAIIANSITAGQIAAGAISTSELAAGSVTTNKLAVIGRGAALNSDPNIQDTTAWAKWSGVNAVFTTVTDGEVGNNVIRSGGAPWSWYNGAERLALDPSKTYRMTVLARKSANADGRFYAGVAAFTSDGTNISGDGTQWSYGAASNVLGSTDWTRYSMEFGAGTARPLPANGVTFAPLVILNYQSTAGYFEAQDIRIEEKIPAELVVDGAITTDKLASNSIDASKIQAGAVSTSQLAANSITASKLSVGFGVNNLITNGGAEDGTTDGWGLVEGTLQTFVAQTSTDVYGGDWRFRIAGSGTQAYGFRAIPVVPGRKYRYRIAFKASAAVASGLYIRINYAANYPAGGFVTQLLRTGLTDFVANGPVTTGWDLREYVWTCPAGVYWASPSIYKWGLLSSVELYFDDVEFGEQVNGTLIQDGVISTDKLAANSVDASKIQAGVITADKITANTITFNKLLGGVIENTTETLPSTVNIAPGDGVVTIDTVTLAAPADTTVGHKPLIIVKIEWNILGSTNWDDDGGDLPQVRFIVNDVSGTSESGQIASFYYTHHTFNDTSVGAARHTAEMIGFFDTAITASKTFYIKGAVSSFNGQVSQDRISVTKCDVIVAGIR